MIDVFIDELDLIYLGFDGLELKSTGRPKYHHATHLKLYLYGYLNRIQSSRRLEIECQRNIELMWPIGRLVPDFKTIADFRENTSEGINSYDGCLVKSFNEPTFQSVHIPYTAFKLANSNVSQYIESIALVFDKTATGRIYVDDLYLADCI